jgi:Cu/Ag efflux protein CusF
MMAKKVLLAAAMAASIAVGCAKQEQQSGSADSVAQPAASAPSNPTVVGQGDGRGVVKAMSAADSTITLDHNTIPGVMDAMAMQYRIDKPAMLTGLTVGDSVTFTLQDRGEGNYVVTAIKKK